MSTYYSEFPLVRYVLDEKENLFVNITRDTAHNKKFFENNPRTYINYTIEDSDTPITLADKLYDDYQLDWTILHFNNIIDYINEWPLNYYEFIEYINEKYNDVNAIHHYESRSTGAVVYEDYDSFDRVEVTNHQYEQRENDKKRKIRIIHPDYITQYVDLFNDNLQVD